MSGSSSASGSRELPLGRARAAGGALLAVALILLAGAGLGQLRHDDRLGAGAPEAEIADPRTPLECAEPAPREGQERDEPVAPQVEGELEVGSGALLDCPQVFDGRRVVFRGEAVGQALGRGERVWLQVNDDVYASEVGPLPGHRVFAGVGGGVGVSLPRAAAETVARRGGPGAQGDTVEVRGIFRRVDPASGEIAVIVADELAVLAAGRPLVAEARADRRAVAYVLLAIALFLGVLQRRRSRRW
jgi:hypothetical protein